MNVAKLMSEKPWRANWPAAIGEDAGSSVLPDVSWKGQVTRYRKIFQALDGVEGASCSVVDAQDLLRKMQSWSDRHASYFSWPPSEDGWARAVWATMGEPQGKEDMAWLWAVYGPSVRLALASRPAPQAWASSLLRAVQEASPAPTASPAEQPSSQVSPAPPSVAAREGKVETQVQAPRERVVSPEVRRTREWMEELLGELSGQKGSEGVVSEKFDRSLKEAIDAQARAGANRVAGWIEYNLLPAIAPLAADKLEMIADLWPSAQSRSFIDPQKTVDSKKFWAVIEETASPEARAVFIDRVLPAVIDASEWSSAQRYQMAVEMLEWTKRRPQVFRERLRLWKSWGGRMDDSLAPAVANEGSMFSKSVQAPETVEEWIRKQAIPEWDAALAPSPRSQRRP